MAKSVLDTELMLAVVGDTNVGKSCLVQRFVENHYDAHCNLVPNKTCTVEVEGKRFILDIGVQREFWKTPVDGYLVVFDVTDQKSFLNVPTWLQEIEARNKHSVRVLVGNKSDSPTNVNLESAKLYAEDDDMPFFAVSAKDGSAVQEAFLTLVSEVMKAKNSQQQYSYKDGKSTPGTAQKKPVFTNWESLANPPHIVPFEDTTRLLDDISYVQSIAKKAEVAKQHAGERAMKAERDALRLSNGDYARKISEREIAVKAEEARWRQTRALQERRLRELTGRCTDLEEQVSNWKTRALNAERMVDTLTEKCKNTEVSLAAESRRAQELEQRITNLEQQNLTLTQQLAVAENRAAQAEERTREAQSLLEQGQSHWIVSPEEIQLSGVPLGTGGWAEVKVGQFRGTKVAVKSLHTIILTPHNRNLFMREMTIAARVRHPNLVQFIGATTEGHPMILMELMPTSLRGVLESHERVGRLSDQQIISIATDVARALNYMHLLKPYSIIHRDISSANVLMEENKAAAGWKAKLSDYGSANFVHQLKTHAPGSPAYAAPESLVPKKTIPQNGRVQLRSVAHRNVCTRVSRPGKT